MGKVAKKKPAMKASGMPKPPPSPKGKAKVMKAMKTVKKAKVAKKKPAMKAAMKTKLFELDLSSGFSSFTALAFVAGFCGGVALIASVGASVPPQSKQSLLNY